jgi:ankyrin repeat protein
LSSLLPDFSLKVQYLVSKKANASHVTLNGVTSLHHAADNDNLEMVSFLLQHGASLPDYLNLKTKGTPSHFSLSPFHSLSLSSILEITESLLFFRWRYDVHSRQCFGKSSPLGCQLQQHSDIAGTSDSTAFGLKFSLTHSRILIRCCWISGCRLI